MLNAYPARRSRHQPASPWAWLPAAIIAATITAAAADIQFLEDECEGEFSLRATVKASANVARDASAELVYHYQDERNYCLLKVTGASLALAKIRAGQVLPMASAAVHLVGGDHLVTLQRRQWRVNVVWDGQTLIRSYDSESTGGKMGSQVLGAGIAIEEVTYQPTEPVYFTDDFARSDDQSEVWETLDGDWGLEKTKGEYSSNRFSWRSRGKEANLCSTGYWFWDSYKCEVAATTPDAKSLGVAAFIQDPYNYLLLRWTRRTAESPGEKQLLVVRGGKQTILATKPGGFYPNQWHSLGIAATGGRVHAAFDGRRELSADCALFGQGKIGLYAEGAAQFDDVRAEATDGFREVFNAAGPLEMATYGAEWTVKRGGNWAAYAKTGAGSGLATLGRDDWRDYVYGADVKPGASTFSGIAFGLADEKNYEGLLCSRKSLRLVRVRDGNEQLIRECPVSVNPAGWHRLKVDVSDGVARCYLDNEFKFPAAVKQELAGKIGLRADGEAGAAFDNLVIWFHEDQVDTSVVFEQFTKEDTMKAWANPAYSWQKNGNVYWHLGRFFGDARIEATLAGGVKKGAAALALSADGENANSGYTLTMTRAADGVEFQLARQNQAVATAKAAVNEPAQLSFFREGGLVAASLNGEPLLSHYDPQPLGGRHVALTPGGGLGIGSAAARSANLLDDTFSTAPTHWWGERGNWQITPRWPCDDRWTFFGGLDSDAPMLWSRHRYEGDVVFEAWLAQYMDNIDDPRIGYKHLGNLNIAICGDGQNVSSGYTFIFAGHEGTTDNAASRITRGDKVVAETKDVVMIKPMRLNVPWQRHWFHIRGEKRGGQLRMFVDGKLALEYNDPVPLEGGQVACWGYQNGLMVARARCWYEKDAGPAEAPMLLTTPVEPSGTWRVDSKQLALVSTFEGNTNGWVPVPGLDGMLLTLPKQGPDSSGCLRVTTPFSGGDFVVGASLKPFDPRKFAKLSFDYKLDPSTKVNLYVKIGASYRAILFSAPDSPGQRTKAIGTVEGVVADGAWHRAEVDLAAIVNAAFPNQKDLKISNVSFAGPRDDLYLRAGFGGNHFGTSFCLDNVRLSAVPGTTVEELKAVVAQEG